MTEPKKVAHVLWRSAGGIRRHVRTVAATPPSGFETAGVWGPADLAGYFDGIPFTAITRSDLLRPPADVDVIHAHGMTAGICALARRRPPVVVSLHVVVGKSGRTRSSAASLLARRIVRRADAVIAVSVEAAEGFGNARVIAPAFEALPTPSRNGRAIRADLGAAPEDVVTLTVARLEDTKRLDLFINAIEAAGGVGWIVGDGPERERLEALAVGSRTKLLGYRDDVSDLLAASDVFALPSVSESYGIAVAEAIAAGIPVVATSTGAIGELVGSGGILVPPDDEDAFVEAVRSLVGDDQLRARRARAARDVVLPDASSLIAQLGAVYDEVIEGRG
jgi:glycosyltransferase involved in cell wall biosynthesis